MYGAILGDIFGSIYEHNNRKTVTPEEIDLIDSRCRFTDDTVLTVAVADAVMSDGDYKRAVKDWANRYPHAGYGGSFRRWFRADNPEPYNSWGNGSAMRVSAIGWVCKSLDEVLAEAKNSADITHNHPEGVKGAQAVAAAVFLARINSKDDIRDYIEETFGYDLRLTIDEIRPDYRFDVSCQGSVPEAIIAFLESRDFVHSIQLAISIGGDTDTIACITGAIAEAFYRKIPDEMIRFAHDKLPEDMRLVLQKFCRKYSKADKSAFPEFYQNQQNERKLKQNEDSRRHADKLKRREERQQEALKSTSQNGDEFIVGYDMDDLLPGDFLNPSPGLQYLTTNPELAAMAASRRPAQPPPLADYVAASVLFIHIPELLFERINPLQTGYAIGSFNDMPDGHCIIMDDFYSDQTRLQYVYYVLKSNGAAYFSLIVSRFEDEYAEDARDPNRVRFLEYLRHPENWNAILGLKNGHGYVLLDFVAPARPVRESEIPPEYLKGIDHITAHVNRIFDWEAD